MQHQPSHPNTRIITTAPKYVYKYIDKSFRTQNAVQVLGVPLPTLFLHRFTLFFPPPFLQTSCAPALQAAR